MSPEQVEVQDQYGRHDNKDDVMVGGRNSNVSAHEFHTDTESGCLKPDAYRLPVMVRIKRDLTCWERRIVQLFGRFRRSQGDTCMVLVGKARRRGYSSADDVIVVGMGLVSRVANSSLSGALLLIGEHCLMEDTCFVGGGCCCCCYSYIALCLCRLAGGTVSTRTALERL